MIIEGLFANERIQERTMSRGEKNEDLINEERVIYLITFLFKIFEIHLK